MYPYCSYLSLQLNAARCLALTKLLAQLCSTPFGRGVSFPSSKVVVPASAAALFSSLHDASAIGLYPCCSYLSRCSSVHHVARATGLLLVPKVCTYVALTSLVAALCTMSLVPQVCTHVARTSLVATLCSLLHDASAATGLYPCCSYLSLLLYALRCTTMPLPQVCPHVACTSRCSYMVFVACNNASCRTDSHPRCLCYPALVQCSCVYILCLF